MRNEYNKYKNDPGEKASDVKESIPFYGCSTVVG
jgi:hypothetical protein